MRFGRNYLGGVSVIGRLALAQRVVIVIAWALTLAAVGAYVTSLGGLPAQFGWFGYAPLTRAVAGPDLTPWEQLVVWIGLIAVWTATSVLLLSQSAGNDRATSS